MKFGSLFSGIGGIDLGLERAGMSCAWQVEIDSYCQKILSHHWPSVTRFGDIREVGSLDSVDVLAGGFPCQDVAQGGQKAGIEGSRSGLWSEFARIIRELRPRYVLVENVPGLLVRGMGRVLGDLAASGYDAEWQSLPAASFGAPHIRERVFILAYPRCESRDGDGPDARRSIVYPEGQRGITPEWSEDRKLVALVPGIHPGVVADWWRTQSRVDRSVDEFPERLAELRAFGNAVLPCVAEWLGQQIVESRKR